MPKMATKAADNVFYKARIAAASWKIYPFRMFIWKAPSIRSALN